MIKIFITENTYEKIKGEIIFQGCLEEGRIACQKCDNGYLIDFYNTSTDIDLKYTLVEEIFKKAPNDGNYWTINDEQFSLTEQEALKAFFQNSEGKDDYLWSSRKILGDIINDKNLVTLEQLQELAETPFSGMLLFDEYDYKRLFWPYSSNLTLPIKSEDTDIIVFNRYIKYDFDITRGKVKFRNCVIEGNIDIARSEWVEFSQCIILGNLSIRDTDQVYISSCNIKSFSVIASKNLTLDIQQSKIYRYVSFDNTVAKLVLYKNVFFEPYIVHTRYLDETTKMCVNQFKNAKINKRMLKRITEKGEIKIKNESCFYLTFIYNKPIESAAIEDVALNMVTGLLEHGDLTKNHHLYADLKYKKALYSNKGVKKFFVFLTGAFYKRVAG